MNSYTFIILNIAVNWSCKVRSLQNYEEYLQLILEITENNLPIQLHIAAIFAAFNKVRFLTALGVGELGSEILNPTYCRTIKSKRTCAI